MHRDLFPGSGLRFSLALGSPSMLDMSPASGATPGETAILYESYTSPNLLISIANLLQ